MLLLDLWRWCWTIKVRCLVTAGPQETYVEHLTGMFVRSQVLSEFTACAEWTFFASTLTLPAWCLLSGSTAAETYSNVSTFALTSSVLFHLWKAKSGFFFVFPFCWLALVVWLITSQGDSDTDSEVEDRVDGVKSWLSKSKGSAKNLSDDGSLKSSRSVRTELWLQSVLSICPRGTKHSRVWQNSDGGFRFSKLVCFYCHPLCEEKAYFPRSNLPSCGRFINTPSGPAGAAYLGHSQR